MVDFSKRFAPQEDHIGDDIKAMIRLIQDRRSPLTHEEWRDLRMNSWEREAMIPFMSDELLVEQVRFTIRNCSRCRAPAVTYDEALQKYAEECAKRLERAVKK